MRLTPTILLPAHPLYRRMILKSTGRQPDNQPTSQTHQSSAGNFPGGATRNDALVTEIIGLITFFLGGLLTGATAWVRGVTAGLINGFCLWALGTVLILVLSTLGLGALFGATGNAFNQLLIWWRGVNFGALGLNPDQFGSAVRDGALWRSF
jgi:hypothetical protein